MLETIDLTKRFGGLTAVDSVSLSIEEEDGVIGLIGPNGAGKTTLFNLITSVLDPTSGYIKFKGEDITSKNPDALCKLGISRTFQISRSFLDFTPIENVVAGFISGRKNSLSLDEAREEAKGILDFMEIPSEIKDKPCRSLTPSNRKLVELGRALATEPELLLLDEMMTGLSPEERNDLMRKFWKIEDEGVVILWVEHDISSIRKGTERVFVIDEGKIIYEGTPEKVLEDEQVKSAYLGAR